ncbi:uncharacterized protein B0H18DRAFT_521844 [Fomitopsis serialis]|uniref:uncharacterized protein n=1 Tax=Fomitopsis serialis TaxID=139415 RepID=UPI002007B3BB|nr:uncharacterized protein B0H18DRAFT_521844 [Neoantrodia serialis]KAH9922183.1 hypothetical protein B0H18DRAFT_521844 [Neoantrodia serialis]
MDLVCVHPSPRTLMQLTPLSPGEATQQSTLDVTQAPWTRWLTVEPCGWSPEQRRFLVTLYIRSTTFDVALVTRGSGDNEPCDIARTASVVFARLPSNYFVLMVKSKDTGPEAEDEYHTLILTAGVSFEFSEMALSIRWREDHRLFAVSFKRFQEFWATVACIRMARIQSGCHPELRTAFDEAEILRVRLQQLEERAFTTALEASTSVA